MLQKAFRKWSKIFTNNDLIKPGNGHIKNKKKTLWLLLLMILPFLFLSSVYLAISFCVCYSFLRNFKFLHQMFWIPTNNDIIVEMPIDVDTKKYFEIKNKIRLWIEDSVKKPYADKSTTKSLTYVFADPKDALHFKMVWANAY